MLLHNNMSCQVNQISIKPQFDNYRSQRTKNSKKMSFYSPKEFTQMAAMTNSSIKRWQKTRGRRRGSGINKQNLQVLLSMFLLILWFNCGQLMNVMSIKNVVAVSSDQESGSNSKNEAGSTNQDMISFFDPSIVNSETMLIPVSGVDVLTPPVSGNGNPLVDSLKQQADCQNNTQISSNSLAQLFDYNSYLDDEDNQQQSSTMVVVDTENNQQQQQFRPTLSSSESSPSSYSTASDSNSNLLSPIKSPITRRQVFLSDLSDWTIQQPAQSSSDYVDLNYAFGQQSFSTGTGSGSRFSTGSSGSTNANRVLIADHYGLSSQAAPSSSSYSNSFKSSQLQYNNNNLVTQQHQNSNQLNQQQQQTTTNNNNNNKMGPLFSREPPGFIYYLNSSDLVIPCSATGNPEPTITWWHQNAQLESGSLLDKRYVRYDNSLVISAFKGHEFQQDIHSTVYKCQASNAFGTITSRNVVINAGYSRCCSGKEVSSLNPTTFPVIDQDFELSVADQFVSADNDALFRCQLSPTTRDFLQVSGWLEDGQLIAHSSQFTRDQQLQTTNSGGASASQLAATKSSSSLSGLIPAALISSSPTSAVNQRNQQQQQAVLAAQQRISTPIQLADGQLIVPHVHLRDANKSYRCQVRNLLNGKLLTSLIGGRLFVTDIDDQSGSAPRIIEAPKQTSVGRFGESMQLVCLAQGSPRPTIRWFRQKSTSTTQQTSPDQAEWTELSLVQPFTSNSGPIPMSSASTSSLTASSLDNNINKVMALNPDLTLIQIRSLSHSDIGTRFRCLANNSFGQQTSTTEIKIDLWPPTKLVELEPKVEYVSPIRLPSTIINNNNHHTRVVQQHSSNSHAQQQPNLTLNCTIRAYAIQPLLAIEWLRNGQTLFSITSPSLLTGNESPNSMTTTTTGTGTSDMLTSLMIMMMTRPLTLASDKHNLTSLFDLPQDKLDSLINDQMAGSGSGVTNQQASNAEGGLLEQQETRSTNYQQDEATDTTSANINYPPITTYRQSLKFISAPATTTTQQLRDTFLYQLHLSPVTKSERGAYQCRAHYLRYVQQATSHLLLRDQAPQFIETFPSQLVARPNPGHLTSLFHRSSSMDLAENDISTTSSKQTSGTQQILHTSSVSLKCIASGSPLPEISWLLSGFQIPESSRIRVGDYVTRDGLIVSFVNISQIQVEDGGLYECYATNDAGQARHSAWLNVTGPPHIRPMSSMNAVAGRQFQIMCPVGGWPIDQISWYQNSTKLPTNHRQKLFPNGTLQISELTEITDSGQYSCQAKTHTQTNDLVATGHLQLTIRVPPVVEPFQFAKSLHRGQRYNVMCTVVRGDLPVSIRWFKDGLLIPESSNGLSAGLVPTSNGATGSALSNYNSQQQQQQPFSSSSSNQQQQDSLVAIKQLDPYSSTLTFGSLQSHHRGLYTCEAENEAGRANQSSQLVIHVPPEWRIEPKDAFITVGRTAVIDCQADAFPAARIEWRLSQDSYRESPSEFKPIISSLYMRVFENGSLIIYNSQRSDAGYYLCQATNGVGPGLSRVIKLTVNVAAHFKTKIRTELVKRSQSAKLRCESIGDPPIEINWLRDKQPLYAVAEPRYTVTKSQLPDGVVSELYIPETERSDSALFTCISQNQYGNDDTNIQLLVQAVPDTPSNIRVGEVESRSVRISWTPGHTGNSPIQRYIISYALVVGNHPNVHSMPSGGSASVSSVGLASFGGSSNANLANQWQQATNIEHYSSTSSFNNISIPGNETSYQLTQLSPLTEYQFLIIAQNHIGFSKIHYPNDMIKFKTKDESPSNPLTMIKAQAISSRAVRVKFRLPERRTHFGQPMGVYLGYKQLKSSTQATSPTGSTPTSSTPSASESSSALISSPELAGASGAGNGNLGFTFRTLDLTSLNGQLYSTISSLANGTLNQQQLDQECLLTGLKRGQKYLITLQPFNSEGTGPASEPLVVETWHVDVPDPPNLRLILRTSHSIHLAWRLASTSSNRVDPNSNNNEQPETETTMADSSTVTTGNNKDNSHRETSIQANTDGPILGFILTRKQLPNGLDQTEGPTVEMKLPSEHLSQIVDNLQCGTRYQFTIVAINSVGPSAPSEPLTVKTEGSVPVAPDKSSLLSLNASSLMINLGTWHNGACQMRSFEVLFKQSKSPKWTPLTTYLVGTNGTIINHHLNATGNSAKINNLTGSGSSLKSSRSSSTNTVDTIGNNNGNNQTIVIANLTPMINYDLKIVATNEAGSTEAYYTFNTNLGIRIGRPMSLSEDGSNSVPETLWAPNDLDYRLNSPSSNLGDLLSANPLISWVIFCMLMIVSSAVICIFLVRRRHKSSSNCSLSLSTTSRTNRESSTSANYYETSNKTTSSTSAIGSGSGNDSSAHGCSNLHHHHHHHLINSKIQQQLSNGSPFTDPHSDELELDGSRIRNEPWQHLDLYGTSSLAVQQQLLGSSAHLSLLNEQDGIGNISSQTNNYGYARGLNVNNNVNGPLDDGSDLTSVIGPTSTDGTEMCLGATALNHIGEQQHPIGSGGKQRNTTSGEQYYVSPLLVQAAAGANQQQQLNKFIINQALNRSATLPHNCHQAQQQVVMQQLLQQQQQLIQTTDRRIIDAILADNIQFHEQNQRQQQHDNGQSLNGGNFIETTENLALLEHQLQHQVYATVKRGCPKPPQFRDYSIYQCPATANHQQQQHIQQNGNDSSRMQTGGPVSLVRCCDELMAHQQQHDHQTGTHQPDDQDQLNQLCFPQDQQMSNGTALTTIEQQPDQTLINSDYQQLRPQAN